MTSIVLLHIMASRLNSADAHTLPDLIYRRSHESRLALARPGLQSATEHKQMVGKPPVAISVIDMHIRSPKNGHYEGRTRDLGVISTTL
jgi:hypothetical protein